MNRTSPKSRAAWKWARAKAAARSAPAGSGKVRITLRIEAEALARWRASGEGWQTRIDAALRQFIQEHPQQS